jgi:hypothetical protein
MIPLPTKQQPDSYISPSEADGAPVEALQGELGEAPVDGALALSDATPTQPPCGLGRQAAKLGAHSWRRHGRSSSSTLAGGWPRWRCRALLGLDGVSIWAALPCSASSEKGGGTVGPDNRLPRRLRRSNGKEDCGEKRLGEKRLGDLIIVGYGVGAAGGRRCRWCPQLPPTSSSCCPSALSWIRGIEGFGEGIHRGGARDIGDGILGEEEARERAGGSDPERARETERSGEETAVEDGKERHRRKPRLLDSRMERSAAGGRDARKPLSSGGGGEDGGRTVHHWLWTSTLHTYVVVEISIPKDKPESLSTQHNTNRVETGTSDTVHYNLHGISKLK